MPSEEPNSARLRRLRTQVGSSYLPVYAVAVVLGQSIRHFVGMDPVVKAQPASIVVPLIGMLLALPLWVLSDRERTTNRWLLAFLATCLTSWLAWLSMTLASGAALDLTALTLGPFLLMVMLRTPNRSDAAIALTTVSLVVAGLFVAAALLNLVQGNSWATYPLDWPIINRMIPSLQRWHAPYNGPAESAALGCLIAIWGATRRGPIRLVLVVVGLVMIAFGGVAVPVIACLVGLFCLGIEHRASKPNPRAVRLAASAGVLVVAVATVAMIAVDPTLNGRHYIWSDYLQLWSTSPITGAGPVRISEFVETLMWRNGMWQHGAPNGHNVFIDTLARYGLVGLLLLVATLALALIVTLKGAFHRAPEGFALLLALLLMSLTETTFSLLTLNALLIFLLLATLVAVTGPTTRSVPPRDTSPATKA